MIAPQSRRLVTAGTLSLALALASPVAAVADPGEEKKGKGDRGASEQSKSGKGDNSSRGRDGSSSTGSQSSAGGSADRRSSGSRGTERQRGDSPADRGASGTGRAASGDPRGNNGTVKIDGEVFDDGRGNEPHVGCVFQLDFYGFDAGDAATISFTGHAPTGGGLLHSQHSTISEDAAGGGQDRDATLTFSVMDQLSELLAIAPHAQQGWHVKVAVDVDSAPGGAKQKVFWISCPPEPAVTGTQSDAASGAGTTTTTTPTTTQTNTTASSPTAVDRRALPLSALPPTFGEGATQLAGGSRAAGTAVSGAGAAQAVSARGTVSPRALPFTGTQALTALVIAGVAALGVGAVAARLGRRSDVGV